MPEDRLAQVRTLLAQREDLDNQIGALRIEIEGEVSTLFGTAEPKANSAKSKKHCGTCGQEGHTTRTCRQPKRTEAE